MNVTVPSLTRREQSEEGQGEVCQHPWNKLSTGRSYDGVDGRTWTMVCVCGFEGLALHCLDTDHTAALEGRKAAEKWKEKYEQERHFKRNANLALGDAGMAKLRLEERIRELEAALLKCHNVMDDTNAAAGIDGPMCVWCHAAGYDGDGLRHKPDCALREARALLTSPSEGSTGLSGTEEGSSR